MPVKGTAADGIYFLKYSSLANQVLNIFNNPVFITHWQLQKNQGALAVLTSPKSYSYLD